MARLQVLLLFAVCIVSAAFGQSLDIADLTRIYHYSPDRLLEFMKEKKWDGNTTSVEGSAFDMSWQFNNSEDIVVKQDSTGYRFVSYRLHKAEDIEAYKKTEINFARFDKLPSNKKNVEIYRHKHIMQMLTTNTTKGILTIRYEVHSDVGFWNDLVDRNSRPNSYEVGSYLPDEGGVVFGVSPDSSELYIVAMEDMKNGGGCSWSSQKGKVPGCFISTQLSKAHYDYAGKANSKAIFDYVVSNKEAQVRAVQLACGYHGGMHDDWYMPSIAQLRLIADNKADIDEALRQNGGVSIAKMWYWSSSQFNDTMVWAVNFKTLTVGQSAKDGHDRVRPVRSVRLK